MAERVYVQLSDGREGPYIVTEEHPDGSLVVAPDTSFAAVRQRLETKPGTLADFEAEHGETRPPNGEG